VATIIKHHLESETQTIGHVPNPHSEDANIEKLLICRLLNY